MIESKYLLTFDLKILYSPNVKLALTCKELDLETLEFSHFDGDLDILYSCYELEADKVDLIVKNILNGEIGTELNSKDMYWLQTFENQLSQDRQLLKNNKLVFNYLILKLRLLGFKEMDAKNIVISYFQYKKDGLKIPKVEKFIDAINKKLRKKRFWICDDLYEEKELELKFIRTVLMYKTKLNHKFDFRMFKDEYLKVCEKSFINKIYNFNTTPSYLVKRPLDISDQKQYLFYTYKSHIAEILQYLVEKDFPNLANDEMFINVLIDDMSTVLKLYLTIQETRLFNNRRNDF